jgi:AraC-like DNA-binding protein
MIFETRRPAPPLDAAIDVLWYCRTPARPLALERVLPNGGAQLVVNLVEDETRTYTFGQGGRPVCAATSGAILSGLATRYQIIDTAEQEHAVGVTFRPGGTLPFAAVPAHELQNRDVPLDALWDAHAVERLRSDLLGAATAAAALDVLESALRRQWRDHALHPAVAFAVDDFRRHAAVVRVADVSARIGMSARRFAARFEAEIGLTPKRYCRLLRFQRAVARAHAARSLSWADVALSSGYYDQAHFIHDFQAFSGLTPTDYRRGRTAFQNHVTFLQSAGG